ncbi:MAG: saccharopine dehydrogenase NADP-binding domain-containing protein [Gemmatimonadota bacterium]|nr:saccharopine dehydrogenase NADP-binding domain-containing protein [Gemmatimonadota bacterium]
MQASSPLLIYGANGYSGRLILAEALARGLRPILAGRSAEPVLALARQHGLEGRIAAVDDPDVVGRALDGVRAVLHCAGPFAHTSAPMVAACLGRGVHYMDITGEIAVFERLAAMDVAAKAAGVTLLPGVGFDVVPSDCLAAHLAKRLPAAVELTLAFSGGTGLSHGTATTMVENIGAGGVVRRGGRITPVPAAWRTRTIPFADRERLCVTIPWGDIATAWHSTGIPDITVYMATSPGTIRFLRLTRMIGGLLATRPAQSLLKRTIRARPAGPSAERRARARSQLWGEVRDAAGNTAQSRLTAPDGYTLTAMAAVRAAERVLAGGVATGFQTPSRAFGARFVLDIPFTSREDLA